MMLLMMMMMMMTLALKLSHVNALLAENVHLLSFYSLLPWK